jgi:hypothetical protein
VVNDRKLQTPGLDAFWEQADLEGSDEHPLERELSHRLDAIIRYGRLIAEAQANGFDEMAEQLQRQQDREESLARDILVVLRRAR